jgi:dihydroxyacid dehydratase/phosphogluconate dehydratase
LFGYPLDGVVLTIGCDKTTPACLMAAATVNIPAIALSVGPMLNGFQGRAHRQRHHRMESAPDAGGGRDRL